MENEHPMMRAEERTTEGVYFIRFARYVKIGYGKDVAVRQRAHLTDGQIHDNPGKVVAVVSGSRDDEHAVHKYFNAFRYDVPKLELFHHARELTDYIRWLRKQYFVEAGDDDKWQPEGIVRDLPVADSLGWLPANDRRVEYEPDLLTSADDYAERIVTGDDYYTPSVLMEMVREAMGGHITLDPASHAVAQRDVKAASIYTKAENGLLRPWHGNVWLNPPFSQWPEFCAKSCRELDSGNINLFIALASCTVITTGYIRPLMERISLMIVPDHRFVFGGPHAGASTSGHVLLVAAKDAADLDLVERVFGRYIVWSRT